MKIDKRFAPLLTGMMALFTTSFATFLAVTINHGWRAGFLFAWLKTFAVGYILVTPFILLVFPRVQKLVGWLTKN